MDSEQGYSLKKGQLKRWIYENNLTQPYVARKLNMRVREFKDKLKKHKLFTDEQIRNLVYLMSAKEAIKVIYFPTKGEKWLVDKVTLLPKGGR